MQSTEREAVVMDENVKQRLYFQNEQRKERQRLRYANDPAYRQYCLEKSRRQYERKRAELVVSGDTL